MNPRVEFDLHKLKENISKLKNSIDDINFLFPVKCCNNTKVLKIIANSGFGFDISNKNEYELIKNYVEDRFISVSSSMSFELDGLNDIVHVVSNNFGSLKKDNGLRINFNSNNKFEFSRFGVDYKKVDCQKLINIQYVHFHNSDHKDLQKCQEIYLEIKEILKRFPNLKVLNIGGHLEDLSFQEGIQYLKNIRDIVPKGIKIYAELGDFLFKNAGKLFCKVIDVRYDEQVQIVTLNFSKMANQRWAYPCYEEEKKDGVIETIFYGCSCCESDVYLKCYARKFKVGEELLFENISPYSYQWNTSFNGINKMKYIFK